MTQLVLLVIAAAWLAVLLPPMLRSRVENRPNSSVTDFRRQLTKLQHTATPPRGSMRAMGRPLAPSPLSRPAAAGRPGQPTLRSGVTRQPTRSELAAREQAPVPAPQPAPARRDPSGEMPRMRSHGDPTGGQRRPASAARSSVKQRRANILFVLFVSTACTLFLAATTQSTVMIYAFVLAFFASCIYVWMLVQARERQASSGYDAWFG